MAVSDSQRIVCFWRYTEHFYEEYEEVRQERAEALERIASAVRNKRLLTRMALSCFLRPIIRVICVILRKTGNIGRFNSACFCNIGNLRDCLLQ